ncbi:MAG: hypothetical protein JWP69_827 [Flaviaesturariibacter sp.]|nr:hypothetical protein [Flaviaesturariibacter sp.]
MNSLTLTRYKCILFFCALFLIAPPEGTAQKTQIISPPDASGFATVIAGEQYEKRGLQKLFLGEHYRQEWTTPVRVRVLNMDTLGGLTPTEQGGGRQTKTLRLKDARGKEYVLRTIDKDYGGALPEITHGTFIERLAKDQVSTAHPYAAVTVPMLAEAAQIFHTNPQIVLVPQSSRLGTFNAVFANMLCLFEERPDDDQSDAANFGYSKEVVNTAKMQENILEKNNHKVDQRAFVRARLFDIFIGDWSRHEDQWRWAKFKEGEQTIYRPIPRDRDQVYTLFDGIIPYVATSPEELEHLSSFKKKIKNIKKYNFSARYIDRRLLNELPKETWISEAEKLQVLLTDEIIERSVRQMPVEVFPFSGPTIIQNLKQRRADLLDYAKHYYDFVAEEVEIVGTEEAETFAIKRLDDNQTQVNIYPLEKNGSSNDKPFYSRTFENGQTEELRLFGIAGNDVVTIEGDVNKGIKLRVIGGIDKDFILDRSHVSGLQKKTIVYDNPGNEINTSSETKLRLSSDTAINRYVYNSFKYNSGHTIKTPSFNNLRGIHLRAGYTYRRYHWRKEPFSWEQTLKANYSITNKSLGGDYEGIFNQVIGKWNLLINGRYDQVLKHYFYGVGNDVKRAEDYSYYRLQTSEGAGNIGLQRLFAKHHSFIVNALYETYKVVVDPGHYATSLFPTADPSVFTRKHFGGGGINYSYTNENDEVMPTKGINFAIGASHLQNLNENDRSFQRYSSTLGIHIPFGKALSLSVRGIATTLNGQPEFYQLPWIGGGQTLRGYRRERFRGKTAFSGQNELRLMVNTRNPLFNGKIGLLGFVDEGRVWNPGEASDQWHIGYGAGFFVVPFNRFVLGVNYGISKEDKLFHIRFGKLL